jgi:hypothetical protein
MSQRPESEVHSQFFFRGSTVALGGYISKPAGIELQAQASAALPFVGGTVRSRADKFSIGDGLMSFDFAESTINGRTEGDNSITTVLTVIENFYLKSGDQTLHIDRIITKLVSDYDQKVGGETKVTLAERSVDGLKVNNQAIEIAFADDFLEKNTFGKLKSAYEDENDNKFREKHHKRFRIPPDYQPGTLPASKNMVACNVADSPAFNGASSYHFNDLGTIHLGEMVITPSDRRLAVIRIELGCPVVGNFVINAPGTNGTNFPPP